MPRYNLTYQRQQAEQYLAESEGFVEINRLKASRSSRQNRALHLWFGMVASQLNEFTSFSYVGVQGFELDMPYTADIVKNFLWRPVQEVLTGKHSTKDLNTQEINQILDVFAKHFAERGMPVVFPNNFDKYLETL